VSITGAAGVSPPWCAIPTPCREIEHRTATSEHAPRSGGRQPAVVGDTDAMPGKSNIAQRLTNTQPGAAGVSPPWSAKRSATALVSHGWLTPAAPDRATNIHCKARACRCTNARAQERRASARRGRRYRRHAGKVEHSTATNEHATRSGGSQPAVVGETLMQRR
jgi:hypothetical protein